MIETICHREKGREKEDTYTPGGQGGAAERNQRREILLFL